MSKFNKNVTKVILSGLLITCLFLSLHADSKQCVWKDVEKIIAIGDIHGDYDNFVMILKRAELVDNELKWTGGKTHLVQTGDILDRGDNAKEVFDLIKKLEIEAEKAGGKVHMLIGNHEEMNITGTAFRQPAYVTAEQFKSFLPDDFRKRKEAEFRKQLQKISDIESNSDPTFAETYLETKWKKLSEDKRIQRLYVNTFNENYGKWIIEHNAVIKINDTIFSHGGISERYSSWPLEKINETLRKELDAFRLATKRGIEIRMRPEIVYGADSPLWSRDLAFKDEKSYAPVVNKILENMGAKTMVIAHTPKGSPVVLESQEEERDFRTRFDERIWMIDTGISELYYGILSYLHYENEEFFMYEWMDEESEEDEPFEPSKITPGEISREDEERYLLTAAVVEYRREAIPGRTAPGRVNLDDGEFKRQAMFKIVDVTRPESLPDSYKYELAAYALDKLLGFGKIPPMVEREIENTKGSLQIRVEDCTALDDLQRKRTTPPDPQAFSNALEEINFFENLVYKERDELDDILIHEETWRIFRVDFSQAFEPSPDLIPEQEITRCSKALFQNLQKLSDEVIKARLKDYLNDEEMSALLTRKSLIIQTLKKLIEEKGEAAVLF
jgi:hypothetical protein